MENTDGFQDLLGAGIIGVCTGAHVFLAVGTEAVLATDECRCDELLSENDTVGSQADNVIGLQGLSVLSHQMITRHAESLTVSIVASIATLILVGNGARRHSLRNGVGQLVTEAENTDRETLDLVFGSLNGLEELKMRIRFHHGDVDNVLLDLSRLKVLEHLLDRSSGMGQSIRCFGILRIRLTGTIERAFERSGGDVGDTRVESHIVLILWSASEHSITLKSIAGDSSFAPTNLMMHACHVVKNRFCVPTMTPLVNFSLKASLYY